MNSGSEDVKLTYSQGYILIRSPFALKDAIKSGLSDRTWDSRLGVWKAPLRIVDEVKKLFPHAQVSSALKEAIVEMNRLKEMSGAVTSIDSLSATINENTLMPFQQIGVNFIDLAKGKVLIADEMGLGKTIQALAWLYFHPELRPVLIVCPASLKLNWKREAKIWLHENALAVDGKGMVDHDIYIISYDMLKSYKDVIINRIKPQVLILDESHYVKNHRTARTIVAAEISRTIPNRILLTGTPILNKPKELWTQLNIIDPVGYDNFFAFANKYCGARKTIYGWSFEGATNIPKLNDELKSLMIRRMKSQVLAELPDKRKSIIPIEIDNLHIYQSIEKDLLYTIKSGHTNQSDSLVAIETLKQLAVEGKMNRIIEWITDFLETGEKLVVFATHRFVIQKLMNHFACQAVSITGDSGMFERQRAVDDFQNRPDIKLFVGNIIAAGVGITLTAASNVAFIELPWTPSALNQAEDRVHRIGQKDSVNIYYLVAAETIESKIILILKSKSNVIDSIMDGKVRSDLSIFNELVKIL